MYVRYDVPLGHLQFDTGYSGNDLLRPAVHMTASVALFLVSVHICAICQIQVTAALLVDPLHTTQLYQHVFGQNKCTIRAHESVIAWTSFDDDANVQLKVCTCAAPSFQFRIGQLLQWVLFAERGCQIQLSSWLKVV